MRLLLNVFQFVVSSGDDFGDGEGNGDVEETGWVFVLGNSFVLAKSAAPTKKQMRPRMIITGGVR